MRDTLAQLDWGSFEPDVNKLRILSLERTLENFQLSSIKSPR